MRSRRAVAAAAIVLCTGLAASQQAVLASDRPAAARTILGTRPFSYLGVFEPGGPASYAPVQTFARTAGRAPNVVMYYSTMSVPFPAAFASTARAHGASLLISLEPDGLSMASIAAGHDDRYLRSYAAQVRRFGHPVIISFAPEMNGKWYPWGWTHTSPKTWIRAWRHVVTLFRKASVGNATWLWTVNQMTANEGPIADWWPGSSYVNWMGIDGYYYHSFSTFDGIFGRTITAERRLSKRPIFIAETAIGQVAGQARRIPQLFAAIAKDKLLGFLWFDMAQSGTIFHQDWRLEGHKAAISAFRAGIRRYMR